MPMDVADFAQDLIEQRLDQALAKRKTLSLPFSGFCLFCQEPVVERRYCCVECRDGHQALLRRRMIDPSAK